MIPFPKKPLAAAPTSRDRTYTVDQLAAYSGEKFAGGLGYVDPAHAMGIDLTDYWTMRAWSNKLFQENLYARGLIRRLVTNEINTGLTLEATPVGELLGLDDDATTDWSDDVERRFTMWAADAEVCDHQHLHTFGKLQRIARMTALVAGDVLVVSIMDKRTKTPSVRLIPGEVVQTPFDYQFSSDPRIDEGVEVDSQGRHVAFWVRKDDGTSERIPAYGPQSGLKQAWMVYGTERRIGRTRGAPILSLVMQSLKEMDRMRDSELRASVINALFALTVEKSEDKIGTKPLSGAAVRRDSIPTEVSGLPAKRDLTVNGALPGIVIDELQVGEKLVSHATARPNINYAAFEAAVLSAVAWANEIPPEIFLLQFGSNYSASRAATNEFKLYLNKAREEFTDEFNKPLYTIWLLSEVLKGNIEAPGFLQAWRSPSSRTIVQAWVASDWGGAIKPNVDLNKEVKGYKVMVDEGWITNDRAAKELTGTKFATNIKRTKRENQMKADAMRPMLEVAEEFKPDKDPGKGESDGESESSAVA